MMLVVSNQVGAAAAGQNGNTSHPFGETPASARPHTWWHWMNGSVRAGGDPGHAGAVTANDPVYLYSVASAYARGITSTDGENRIRGQAGTGNRDECDDRRIAPRGSRADARNRS